MSDPLKKSSDRNIVQQMLQQRAEEELRGVAERQIVEAQKKGHFDNLAGKGKPLRLRKNHEAGDQALAFELLQNNDYTVPWIAARKEMLEAIDVFRADIVVAWRSFEHTRASARSDGAQRAAREEWQVALAQFGARVRELTQEITALNLTIPVERLEVIKLSLQRELARAGASA